MMMTGFTTGIDRNNRASFSELANKATELDLIGAANSFDVMLAGSKHH